MSFFDNIMDVGKGLAEVASFGILDFKDSKDNISQGSILAPNKESEEERKKRQKKIEQSVLANQTGFRQGSVLTRF